MKQVFPRLTKPRLILSTADEVNDVCCFDGGAPNENCFAAIVEKVTCRCWPKADEVEVAVGLVPK